MSEKNFNATCSHLYPWWAASNNAEAPLTLGSWNQFYANPCWTSGAPPDSWAEHSGAVNESVLQAYRAKQAAPMDGEPAPSDTVLVGKHMCPVSLSKTLPQFRQGKVKDGDYAVCLENPGAGIRFSGQAYYATFNTEHGASRDPEVVEGDIGAAGAGEEENKGVEAGDDDDSAAAAAEVASDDATSTGDEGTVAGLPVLKAATEPLHLQREGAGPEPTPGEDSDAGGAEGAGEEENKGVEAGDDDDSAAAAAELASHDPAPTQPLPTSTGDEGTVAVLQAQLKATTGKLKATTGKLKATTGKLKATTEQLQATTEQLQREQAHRSAAALSATCSGVDLKELATIVGREPDHEQAPWPALVHSSNTTDVGRQRAEEKLRDSVFAIQHVRDIAGRVLNDSASTPAGILLALLRKVAPPGKDLDAALLSRVVAYVTEEATRRRWSAQKMAHLRTAMSVALTLTRGSMEAWGVPEGELTLECMQVTKIVREPLAAVFGRRLHGNMALQYAMLALVQKTETTKPEATTPPDPAGDKKQPEPAPPLTGAFPSPVPAVPGSAAAANAAASTNPAGTNAGRTGTGGRGVANSIAAHNRQFVGGELNARPDIAIFVNQLVLALGETKVKLKAPTPDRFKLACMSAAASGALQLKIYLSKATANGACHCGEPESLFPIPLIESYAGVLRLYYGKTLHDTEGGKCQHRVGCFFSLQMKTWEDALLALSVMQAVADDVCRRWCHMPKHEWNAAQKVLVGLQPVRTAHKTTPPQSHPRTTPATRHSGRKQADEAMMEGDMAALHAAGVADVTPLFPPPLLIICENDDTPPNDWQLHRVYHGQWTDNGAKRAVIAKVVSRTQAAHEVRVLEAVGAHKESRAIQVLAQIPVNDGDVGLVTPYCPGKLFDGAASLRDVLRQAAQLCEAVMAWHAAGVLHLDLKPSNVAISADGDVVVLDAGISKCVTDGSVAVRGAVGTPGYMAPELRGDGSHVAVAACDVFSLGATYRRALDRWAKATRYSKRRASTAVLTKLRDVCDSMCHHDATKRPPLPEVLTRLQALAYPAAVCENN